MPGSHTAPLLSTLQQLQTMVRRRMGWATTDGFVSDAELRDMLRHSQLKLWDWMISLHQGNWTHATVTMATTAGVATVNMDLGGENVRDQIYRIFRVSTKFDELSVPMRPFEFETGVIDTQSRSWDASTDLRYRWTRPTLGHTNAGEGERQLWEFEFHPVPAASYVVSVRYVPWPPTLSLSTAVNSVMHDEFLVLDTMIQLRNMEEADASDLERRIGAYMARVEASEAPIDMGQVQVVRDVRSLDPWSRGRGY